MSRTERAELTVLCMIYDGARILLQDRVKDNWKGYTFPGGHVEPGESFVDCAIREIKEEVQLIFKPEYLKPAFTYDSDDNQHIYFWTSYTGLENLTIGGEEKERSHSQNLYEARWISLSDFPHLPFRPNDLQIRILSFFTRFENR